MTARANKVWIVMEAYDYEGYGEPEGVYSNRAAAEAKKAELLAKLAKNVCGPDDVCIFECIVDGEVLP